MRTRRSHCAGPCGVRTYWDPVALDTAELPEGELGSIERPAQAWACRCCGRIEARQVRGLAGNAEAVRRVLDLTERERERLQVWGGLGR